MQAVFVTYRCPVGCSFWVKHRVREALTPRLRLVVGQPSNEKRSFPPAARLHLAQEREEARKNKGFTQVYSRGWRRVRELATGNSGAAGLYALFAEHIDPTCGAVICDQQFLADHMKVTTRTIRSWLAYLEENRALVRIPVAGRVCAYALDPHEVWKGYDNAKEYAAFVTKTLVNKDGDIRRRIMSMFSPEERPNDDRDPNTLDMFEGTPHNEQRNEGENLYEKNVRSCCHDGGNRSESCFSGG